MPSWIGPVADYVALGLQTTILLAIVANAISVAVGVIVGALATVPTRFVTVPVRIYVELWRGLPTLVTVFVVFFIVPILFFEISPFVAAVVGLSLWGSANIAEIVRGAVNSIPHEQSESGTALGFGWLGKMRFVLLPQAARRSLPPTVGICTINTQATALASLIGVLEVAEAAQRSVERLTFTTGSTHAIAIFGSVLVVFFGICYPLTRLSKWLENWLEY